MGVLETYPAILQGLKVICFAFVLYLAWRILTIFCSRRKGQQTCPPAGLSRGRSLPVAQSQGHRHGADHHHRLYPTAIHLVDPVGGRHIRSDQCPLLRGLDSARPKLASLIAATCRPAAIQRCNGKSVDAVHGAYVAQSEHLRGTHALLKLERHKHQFAPIGASQQQNNGGFARLPSRHRPARSPRQGLRRFPD